MRILILEDNAFRMKSFREIFRGHTIDHCETAFLAHKKLQTRKYDVVFLDHDLGGEEMVASSNTNTGYYVAARMHETINIGTPIVVHSFNPIGARQMVNVMVENGCHKVCKCPFGGFGTEILDIDNW